MIPVWQMVCHLASSSLVEPTQQGLLLVRPTPGLEPEGSEGGLAGGSGSPQQHSSFRTDPAVQHTSTCADWKWLALQAHGLDPETRSGQVRVGTSTHLQSGPTQSDFYSAMILVGTCRCRCLR